MFDIETTGLDPYKHQVVLIGFKKDGKIEQLKLWEIKDEAKMILESINELAKFDKFNDTIVGYNNLKFDVPFLLERLKILGKMKPEFWSLLYNKKWFDLYQFLGNSFRALNLWLDKLGIKKKYPELDGKKMPEYFIKGDYKKIENHNIDDLNTLEELFYKLKSKFPDLLGFE
ncbi:MAG: ribonuclease H-like domain-containing protein [Candidatus Aenigmatarchaeota archaeon]